MKKLLAKIILLLSAAALLLSLLASCEGTDNESDSTDSTDSNTSSTESGTEAEEILKDFDYQSADISSYITLSPSEYQNNTVTLGKEYIITDEDVSEYNDAERFKNKEKTNADTQVTDQPIKLGDSAFIYYTGYLDGVAFSGGSNAEDEKPYELSIGSGSFIPGFEEGLIGLVPNTTSKDAPFDLHVTFPENYGSKDLAGKAVVFKVWVVYVIQYTIPEFTDEYVQNTLKFDGTAEEYSANVKKELQAESDADAESKALTAIIHKLTNAATIHEYPGESLDYWYAAYVDQYEYYMAYYTMYGYSFESLDDFVQLYLGLDDGEDWKEVTNGYAKEMVTNSLLYYAIAAQQGITASDEELAAEAQELAEYYSSSSKTYTAEEIIAEIGRSSIEQSIIFEKVEDYLMDNCTIEYADVE